jgi:hypothetical protein
MSSPKVELDRAFAEIDAMRTVATALGALRDPYSRVRVLGWAREHFAQFGPQAEGTLRIADGSGAGETPRAADYSALAIGEDLFECAPTDSLRRPVPFVPVDHGPQQPRAESWRSPTPAFMFDGRVRGVARVLRRLTHKWRRAS